MNITICPYCAQAASFEAVEKSVARYKEPLLFIQCSSCHKPIGVMEVYNLGKGLENQDKLLKKIERKLEKLT